MLVTVPCCTRLHKAGTRQIYISLESSCLVPSLCYVVTTQLCDFSKITISLAGFYNLHRRRHFGSLDGRILTIANLFFATSGTY